MTRKTQVIINMNGIRQNEGNPIILEGIYKQHDIRRIKTPTDKPQYYGDVSIELSDGTQVLLHPIWHEEKIRSDSEIKECENKKVRIKGKVYAIAPDSGRGLANMLMPCITDITQIEVQPDREETAG